MKDRMTVSCLLFPEHTKFQFSLRFFNIPQQSYEQIIFANFIFHHDSWQYNFPCLLFYEGKLTLKNIVCKLKIKERNMAKGRRGKDRNPLLYR